MTGTIINTAAIIAGGICGHLFGRLLKERHQETHGGKHRTGDERRHSQPIRPLPRFRQFYLPFRLLAHGSPS